ncbi:E4 SUMO-protein ligase PIAL2-like isoform X2 [Primulina tabacum]|uniref:E4 SUMO-protein ligase PIAL2-like isoform X2 n=1 Tax=Primulina tabacum TaxID=48773 RepID=UPI003F5ACA37
MADTVGVGGAVLDASKLNAFRISVVMDHLLGHVRNTIENDTEFLNLCLSLSRGIDFAVLHYEVPSRVQELPSLLNQVCRFKNNALLQSAIMVLMISVKNACECGWFSNKDSDELINLVKEMASNFCGSSNFGDKATCSLSVTSTIMSRFYPRMRMGHKLVFLEVKPGFNAYVSGFQIPKTLNPSPGQKIMLFVAQADNIMTSSCLTTPSKVNFLVNGKGVEKRTTISMDTGPQIPTDVTQMLKYGSNLLQAVGEFNGNYTIALAFMSEMPNLESSALQDYEQHALTAVDSDSEIIEGPSRISLNCPISFKRIKIPVKGYSCKHIQCFDFDNYVSINSRAPFWRCPRCNQHVCFTDLRIDSKMVKILEEVGTNDTEVIFASDGSWNVAAGTDDSLQKSVAKISDNAQDEHTLFEFVPLSKAPVDVLDLTAIDDAICTISDDEIQDGILTPTNDANQSNACLDDDFWSGFVLPDFGQVSSLSNAPVDGISATASNKIVQTPVLIHPVGPNTPNQELEAVYGNSLVTSSVPQSETSLSTTPPFQQHQFGNSSVTNEYVRFPSLTRNVTRTATAVQALPAQTLYSVLRKRPRNNGSTFTQNSSSATSQASPRAQMIPNSVHMNPFYASQRSSSPLHQYMGMQQNNSFPSIQSSQPSVPDQGRNSFSALNERRSSTPPHLGGPRMPSSAQSPANFSRPQSQVGVSRDQTNLPTGAVTSQQVGMSLSVPASGLMARPVEASRTTPSYMIPNSHRMPSRDQVSNPEITSSQGQTTAAIDLAEQNWRPAGRMRGALSGQAYTDALNQYILRPNQQAQAARPSLPANVPAHLQSLMTDTTEQPAELSHSSGAPVAGPEVSSKLPEVSSGTK